MSSAIWILVGSVLALMVHQVFGQFPLEIVQGTTPSESPNKRTLICRVRNGQPNGYNRIQNAIFYLNGSNVRERLTGSEFDNFPSDGRITIQLRQDLEGEYTCGDGSNTSPESESVILVYQPSPNNNIDLYHAVQVGRSVTLQCGVKQGALAASYTPKWYRGFFMVLDTQSAGTRFRVRRGILEDFSLTITNLLLSDNNNYYCEVDVAGTFIHSPMINLRVYEEPTIQYMTGDRVPFLPSSSQPDAEFVCNASGTPNLTVTWKHNDREIRVPDDKYSIVKVRTTGTRDITHSVLTIKRASITDSGNVKCEASISFTDDSGNNSNTNAVRKNAMDITKNLIVLDTSLAPQPFVTQDSDILVQISLSEIRFPEDIGVRLKLNRENGTESTEIRFDDTFPGMSKFYLLISASKVPTGYRRFWIQVALVANNIVGPYSPPNRTSSTAVDLDEMVNEEECDLFSLHLVLAFLLTVVFAMSVVMCVMCVMCVLKQRIGNKLDTHQNVIIDELDTHQKVITDKIDTQQNVIDKLACLVLVRLDKEAEENTLRFQENERRFQENELKFQAIKEDLGKFQELTKETRSNDDNEESSGPAATNKGRITDDGGEDEEEEEDPVTRENIRHHIDKLRKKFHDMNTRKRETPANPGPHLETPV